VYDWAGSAYATTVATALLPAYFAGVVAGNGLTLGRTVIPATSLWGYAVSLAAILVFVLAPGLGAMSDRGGGRKGFLMAFCLIGGAGAVLLSLTGPGDIAWALGLFVLAHVAFNAGNAFYDSYLPQIAPPQKRDQISSLGYAFGYLGGGLNLALALALIQGHAWLGLSPAGAVRWGLALAGIWWLGFAAVAFLGLPKSPGATVAREGLGTMVKAGFGQAFSAGRLVWKDSNLRRFFLAYLLYNDGVQTVIAMAAIYGKEEIGLSDSVLVFTLLMVQAVAFGGALLFGRLGAAWGTKPALALALAGWCGLALLGRLVGSAQEYLALGLGIGLALGGSQALSRSLYSRLVPAGQSTVYFGFFSVLAKFSAILGPLVFALVRQIYGSSRPAMAVLVLFFAGGLILLARVKEPDHA
jgi:UMF1 family MFS transporter